MEPVKRYPNIEAERARLGMTVSCLTDKLEVSRKTYYNWVSKGHIPQNKLEIMSDVFGVSIQYLLSK